MASLTAGDSIDWLWGGLKPWQILHSTLAERERCGSVLDVWELVNQTLSTSTKSWDGHRSEAADRGRSHEIQFLGDLMDGDFWRHGGVIETRVKECLNSLIISQNGEAKEDDQQLNPAAPHHQNYRGLYKCNGTEVAIASSTHELPCISWKSVADSNHYSHIYCKIQQEDSDQAEITLEDDAAGAVDDLQEEHEEDQCSEGYREEETEEEEEEEEDEEEEDREEDDSSYRRDFTQGIREADNGVTSRNHLASPNHRDNVRDGASLLVLNPCCSPSVAASTARDDQAAAINIWGSDQSTEAVAEESTAAPVLEENIEVCAVCLEKLTHNYEDGVQALDCRHAFHTVCIEPWLQRQPHACCPCCRAPICPDTLAPPLHFSADHRLHEGHYACSGGQQEDQRPAQRAAGIDIMGVLADMEAALERLGFRS